MVNPSHSCFCIGPQNGEPLCPCAMRSVTVENGRYVRKEDLGPVNNPWGRREWGVWQKFFQEQITAGCPVCGLGADGKPMAYVCPRMDCPSAVTCSTEESASG